MERSSFKPKIDMHVVAKESYSQRVGEVGGKLVLGQVYKIKDWFKYGCSTMLILDSGEYVYMFNVQPPKN